MGQCSEDLQHPRSYFKKIYFAKQSTLMQIYCCRALFTKIEDGRCDWLEKNIVIKYRYNSFKGLNIDIHKTLAIYIDFFLKIRRYIYIDISEILKRYITIISIWDIFGKNRQDVRFWVGSR
jgi:hypothetical protein